MLVVTLLLPYTSTSGHILRPKSVGVALKAVILSWEEKFGHAYPPLWVRHSPLWRWFIGGQALIWGCGREGDTGNPCFDLHIKIWALIPP